MICRRRFVVVGTDLHIDLSSARADLVQKITEGYPLTPSDAQPEAPGPSGIVLVADAKQRLPQELRILDPTEAILCDDHVYVNDSRVSLGPPIRVESRSGATIPRTGFDMALSLALAQQGALPLHACGFRHMGTDILAIGHSTSGKSTLAAAVLSAGGQVLTDDQLVCYLSNDRLRAHWLRKDLWLREGGKHALPETLGQQVQPLQVKAETRWRLPRESLTAAFLDCLEPTVLLFLQPRHLNRRQVTVRPINHALAFAELVRASSPVLFGNSTLTLPRLVETCRHLLQAAAAFQVSVTPRLISDPEAELTDLLHQIHEKRGADA